VPQIVEDLAKNTAKNVSSASVAGDDDISVSSVHSTNSVRFTALEVQSTKDFVEHDPDVYALFCLSCVLCEFINLFFDGSRFPKSF